MHDLVLALLLGNLRLELFDFVEQRLVERICSHSTMFLLIIEAVISSSTGVLLIACAGAWLIAFNVIDPKFTSQLSGVVERVLLPALIFTNFLSAITLA